VKQKPSAFCSVTPPAQILSLWLPISVDNATPTADAGLPHLAALRRGAYEVRILGDGSKVFSRQVDPQ